MEQKIKCIQVGTGWKFINIKTEKMKISEIKQKLAETLKELELYKQSNEKLKNELSELTSNWFVRWFL